MSELSNRTIDSCLRAVWRRTQGRYVLGGLLALVRWFLPLFLGVILIDRISFFPWWLRAMIGLALLFVSLRQAWRHGWSKLSRYNATHTAQQVERAHGDMDSLLVTAVQFQQSGAAPGTSAAMWELTLEKAQKAIRNVVPQKIVTLEALKRPIKVALGLGAVLLVLVVLQGPFLGAGLGRLFTPWLAIAYPTDTHIQLTEGELVAKEGAPASIEIQLSGEIPETAELELQTGEGRPREIELEVVDGLSIYQIAAASRDFTYRVKAGDARSDWRQVRIIRAPRLAKVEVELDFPDYIDRANETLEALTMTVPEETGVRWQLTLDSPIRQATLHRDDEEDLPLEIGDDDRTLTLAEKASASRGYSFSWIEDTHGFDFTSPRYFLQVASDQTPRIELTQPEGNLVAMLGRPLELAVRAQDDHGIGSTKISYRINRRPENTIALEDPVRSDSGEQVLDWDYREAVSNLVIGDSITFLVEVADKYPGEGGPHIVRTDSRRITFLSREDYLAEINKQMERLLSQVRTLYRQQRAAHELVVKLDPAADSFLPTCQLEAIRQELVREQLVSTADQMQVLLGDLKANQISDAVEGDSLGALRDALRSIAEEQVGRAADLLRAQVGNQNSDPQPAITAVNTAARELASLVMQRGILASREVFARETAMLADELSRIRLKLITADEAQSGALAKKLEVIAEWTDDLLNQLNATMRYDKRPLFVLGLNRRIHQLESSGLADSIRATSKLAGSGNLVEAAELQYPLIRPLIEGGFTMRTGSEFAHIRGLSEQLTSLVEQQKGLMASSESGTNTEELAARQSQLRDKLVLAALPDIPAPRPQLKDLVLPSAPPSDAKRLQAEASMAQAIAQLSANENEAALRTQREALATLNELNAILDRWLVELAQLTLGVSAEVSDAAERAGLLEQLETSQIELLIQTEEAALDEKTPANLVEDQRALTEEIEGFYKELRGGDAGPSKDMLPLIGRLEATSSMMQSAISALEGKRVEDALEPQELAALGLAEARSIATEQLSKFNLEQNLISFQQAVASASDGMGDVVGGQNDLIDATQSADEEKLKSLLAPQRNLLRCLSDIAPSLDLVAERLDVGTPLVFAASDVEDALFAMEDGDAEDAAEIQEIAVESLAEVQALVAEISVQTGYISEIVEFLFEAQSDLNALAYRQRQLRETSEPENALELQKALAAEAKAIGEVLSEVAGNVDMDTLDESVKENFLDYDLSLNFQAPAAGMAEAAQLLEAGQEAGGAMLAAETALQANTQQLYIIVEMLTGLPSISVTHVDPPELHRLIDVLDIASKQRGLLRQAYPANAQALPAIAEAQEELAQSTAKANEGELTHPLIALAYEQMEPIAGALEAARKAEAKTAQLKVDQTLRHFIIEQALILNTAIPPISSSDSDVLTESETDDLYQTDAVGFVADFVSGERPKDQESEWEILGTRNRAALNQNFARELPLEYRATLKNYFERVAE